MKYLPVNQTRNKIYDNVLCCALVQRVLDANLNLDMAASYKLRFACDIQNATKPSTGAKGVHLSWIFPFSNFVCFFASCTGLKKTKFTYTFKDLNQERLDTTLGQDWDTKSSYGKETVQCIVTLQDVVFRSASRTLCTKA